MESENADRARIANRLKLMIGSTRLVSAENCVEKDPEVTSSPAQQEGTLALFNGIWV